MYQNKLFNAKSHEKHLLKSFIKILSERDHHGDKDFVNNTEVVATLIGKKIGLNNYDLNRLRLLALMHDIGKIGVSKQILSKTEKLTGEEWQKIKGHCQIGYHITKSIPEFSSICKEVLYHHENWDGSGYPTGLKGEKIPLLSRIISIIDSFNTMQSNRPYKRIMTKEESIEEIKKNSGSQFDPNLVSIFLDILKENSD
ncbi:MAG: HD-GYP domain-containing protein [Atribacterota bacterium]|nr:HD-GYP domain-containing protein [Atribacterota bacterium]